MKKLNMTFWVVFTIILMDLLTGMEFDLFVPSFPELQHQFSLSPFWVEALLSVNFLGYCLSLFFVGGLADRFGRKPIILLGLLIFLFGSLLCLWAPFYFILVLGRFLHGVGIAAPAILSFLLIADSFSLKKQQVLLAMMNGVMNMAVAASPVLGSYITLHFHWHGNFIALLALCSLVIVMTWLCIPSQKPALKLQEQVNTFDYLPLFKSKPMLLMLVHIIIMIIPYWIFVGMSPLLYMKALGVSLSHFGYYQGILALLFAVGSIVFGFMVHHFDRKKTLHVTNWIFILSLVTMIWITWDNSTQPLLITLAFIPFVIGQIIPATILYPVCLNYMPKAKGRASAIIGSGKLILSASSLQLAGYVYVGSFQNIGLIILPFILLSIITLYLVIQNDEIMQFTG